MFYFCLLYTSTGDLSYPFFGMGSSKSKHIYRNRKDGKEAVSYTHLDVYKRQQNTRCTNTLAAVVRKGASGAGDVP